jgi:GntR family phosphonate transport system transcriptional regulator
MNDTIMAASDFHDMPDRSPAAFWPAARSDVLDRTGGRALWYELAGLIGRRIAESGMKAGDRIPAEPELARRFGVNRHTVRQAIRSLVDEGVLRVVHGRGTFVQARAIDYPLRARTRYSEILLEQGYEPRRDILDISEFSAGPDEARCLRIRRGARCIRVETRTYVAAETLCHSFHVFPRARLAGIGAAIRETGSISDALARFGHPNYARAWTRITAELPSPELAARLGRPPNRPVLVTESLNVAADGTPLELGRSMFAGDLCRLTVEGDT